MTKLKDIIMFYNYTSIGLNTSLWAPYFDLPTVRYNFHAVEKGTVMVDRVIGEMLLNFMLNEEVRYFCGVDVTNVITEEEWEKDSSGVWERGKRKIMGLKELTYHAWQGVTWSKSIALGDLHDLQNTFAWEKVVLNFPGTIDCDFKRPWVYNKSRYGLLAADLFIHVDDGWPIVPTETLCWEAYRRWGSTCSWLGIQDASRKVQPPSQSPGTWSGTVTNNQDVLHGLVLQERRYKTWRLIAQLVGM